MSFTIEQADNSEETYMEVLELLMKLFEEGGFAPWDLDEATSAVYNTLSEGNVFVAKNDRGEMVGTIAMTEVAFWYSKTTFLHNLWFYVLPRYRRGKVGVELMKAVRQRADELKKLAFVNVDNPRRRTKKTKMTLVSQEAGYVPSGYTIRAG